MRMTSFHLAGADPSYGTLYVPCTLIVPPDTTTGAAGSHRCLPISFEKLFLLRSDSVRSPLALSRPRRARHFDRRTHFAWVMCVLAPMSLMCGVATDRLVLYLGLLARNSEGCHLSSSMFLVAASGYAD